MQLGVDSDEAVSSPPWRRGALRGKIRVNRCRVDVDEVSDVAVVRAVRACPFWQFEVSGVYFIWVNPTVKAQEPVADVHSHNMCGRCRLPSGIGESDLEV